MSRRALLSRSADLAPQNCAWCNHRMILGLILSVTVNDEKFRVCSFECEKKLKAKKEEDHDRCAAVC